MSENYSCRDTYCNYGSYLRSRGFDKELCTLINDLKRALSKMDNSITPGDCESGTPTTISGDVIIDACSNDNNSGTLTIRGGNATNPSIQTSGGAMISGHADFMGDVLIRGNLAVAGFVEDLSAVSVFEALKIESKSQFKGDSLSVFQSSTAQGNLQALWTDISSNISGPTAWKHDLVFAIDGRYNNATSSNGATNVPGHVRGMRGATFLNPPGSTGVNVNYEKDFTSSINKNVALDIYGTVNVSKGNNNANAMIDIQDGEVSIYQGTKENVHLDNDGSGTFAGLIEAHDLSINNHASIYDLSIVNLMTLSTFEADNIIVDTMNANKISVDELNIENPTANNDTLLNIKDGEFSIYDGTTQNVHLKKDGSGTFAGLIEVDDLSVNTHAYIHDLSVVHLMTVGTSTTHISSSTIDSDTLNSKKITVDDLTVNKNIHVDDVNITNLKGVQSIVFDPTTTNPTIDFNTESEDVAYINTNGNMAINSKNILELNAQQYINVNKTPQLIFPELCNQTNTECYPFALFGSARTLMSLTYNDNDNDKTLPNNQTAQLLLSPSPKFSNYPDKTFTTNNTIDFSSDFFTDCIVEFCVSLECNFGTEAEAMTCFITSGPNATPLVIDTRTIVKSITSRITFGPRSFYTDGSDNHIDKTQKYTINIKNVGPTGNITDIQNIMLDMKTTRYATPE